VVSLALLSIPFAVVVGQPLAMLMSFFIYAIKKDNFSEFKSERMDELFNSNAMHNHDVMCAQELYGSRFWGSSYYPTYMKRRAQEAGLCHSGEGGWEERRAAGAEGGWSEATKHYCLPT